MQFDRPFLLETEDWSDIESGLDGGNSIGALSMDRGVLENGEILEMGPEELYFGPAERMKGNFVVIPPNIADEISNNIEYTGTSMIFDSGDRNPSGFYIGTKDGFPAEIKYDDNLPDSEEFHSHSLFEAYAPKGGSITLSLIDDIDNKSAVNENVSEGEVFVVSPYVQHRLEHYEPGTDLAVIRYGQGENAKYNLDGENVYPWSDKEDFQWRPYQASQNREDGNCGKNNNKFC